MSQAKDYVPLTPRALSAIQHALQAMMATPADGDFTNADHRNGEAALAWLRSLPSEPVVVVLTPGEANELSQAAGNSLHDPDAWADFCGSRTALARAQSAHEKLIRSNPYWGKKKAP